MSDSLKFGMATGVVGSIIGLLGALYQAHITAPAAVAARPELADLSFWTALFSGRFWDWFYYNEPLIAGSVTVTVTVIVFFVVGVVSGR
jgi:hypothetical protein